MKVLFKKIYAGLPAGRRRQFYELLMDKGALTEAEIMKALSLKRTQVAPVVSRMLGTGLISCATSRVCAVTGKKDTAYSLIPRAVKNKKKLAVVRPAKLQTLVKGQLPARVVSKALSSKYKGLAFQHYMLHALTSRNIAVTVPMPDSGDDVWFELDGLHRLQLKSRHSHQVVAGRIRYLTNVSGDMFLPSANVALAVGLRPPFTDVREGQYYIGFFSSVFLKVLAAKKILAPSYQAGRKLRYNLHFDIDPEGPWSSVRMAGASIQKNVEVAPHFGDAIGVCPDPQLLVQG